ncbi:site-2 protease family protein [Paracraurococcus lichenis]|uniref:Zinc metalloprotease n=1 Tax=Paracraurococcus lichenis TaxID=3064888 RepID=A0ABT9E3K1_9PROT|nr:site-2 protease family protein [Paracraurococcus sp. LOR1-02]MDO9710749.1 site-2 protease family protein [Paracraurococcus sp. LOR1-02]
MHWSFPILVVRGTVVRIHLTFLLFLLWIGWANYRQGGPQAATESVVFLLLLFLCVLLHEFGHVFAARRYGVQTPDITLLPIGGVARLERIPEKPSEELVVALAGPAVNVVIAALLFLAIGGLPSEAATELQDPRTGILERLATVNVFLVLFNLIPAFPMDGGRVLRALLAWRMGYARATATAAAVGQAVAFGLGILGLFGSPMLLFIAVFVWLGAAGESQAVQQREGMRGLSVAEAMVTRFDRLPPGSVVQDAVRGLIRTTQHEFPVVAEDGRLLGVLTRDCLLRALHDHGGDWPVTEAMRTDIPVVPQRQPLEEAMREMQARGLPVLGVADELGRLVGLLTPENIGEMMLVRAAQPAGAEAWPEGGRRNPWGTRPVA